MAFIIDTAFDEGLDFIDTNGIRVDICTAEPTTYALATTGGANSLGSAVVNTGATQDGDVDGRKVVVPAIAGASVSDTGLAAFWALTDNSSILIATGALAASQTVTSGNTWDLAAFDITIRDAA